MKKKKRILRTVISTMLMCCMLVGDLGSVFATSVGSSVVSEQPSEEEGSVQEVQTLAEPIEEPNLGMQSEQFSDVPEVPVVEEPKVEVESEVETPVETPEVTPEVIPEPTPEVEPEQPEVKPETEVKPEEKPSDSVSNEQSEEDVPVEEPAEPSVETTTPSETDNWSLDLVFYDSTVDGGKTPLKSIDWDASDGGYKDGTSRVITLQINYLNSNLKTTYNKGQCSITIPDLFADTSSRTYLRVERNIGANDETHSGYDWNYVLDKGEYIFSNEEVLSEGTNFEGGIQMKFTVTPLKYLPNTFLDHDIFEFMKTLQASIKEITSDEVSFNYRRDYYHPWEENTYKVEETASAISSYDGFPGNAKDFIWVKYNYLVRSEESYAYDTYFYYPKKFAQKVHLYTKIPSNCVVLNKDLEYETIENEIYDAFDVSKLYPGNNGQFPNRKAYSSTYNTCFYIGYPKSDYSESIVTNTGFLYGEYIPDNQSKVLAQDSLNVNLAEYDFQYMNGHELKKYKKFNKIYYQNLIGEDNLSGDGGDLEWSIQSKMYSLGEPTSFKVGDDLLFITDETGDYKKLKDEEYFFKSVSIPYFANTNDKKLPAQSIEFEIWVRRRNQKDYELFNTYKNSDSRQVINFNDDNVVQWFLLIKDSNTGLMFSYNKNDILTTVNITNTSKIAQSGKIYNFSYLNVYTKGDSGELILKNEPLEDSYNNMITKEDIKFYDINTYGHYVFRSDSYYNYNYYVLETPENELESYGNTLSIFQDVEKEQFSGKRRIGVENGTTARIGNPIYVKNLKEEDAVKGFRIYELLPKGMHVLSSEKEILSSLSLWDTLGGFFDSRCAKLYDMTGNRLFYDDLYKLAKDNTEVVIQENWNNTSRTRIQITIDFSSRPIFSFMSANSTETGFRFDYDYSISYDDFLENGSSYKDYIYTDFIQNIPTSTNVFSKKRYGDEIKDSGVYDKDSVDIDRDNSVEDTLAQKTITTIIQNVTSTHQDVQTSVQTDKSNYDTGLVKASPESEYTYKLRARSGSNQVSNLVLVNNLEEGYGDNEHWKGEFLGIDTSFAENRTYRVYKPSDPRADAEGYVQERVQVKPYYSTSTTEGELYRTEEKVITDPSGEQIVQRVRVVDEHGNFVKNPNWLEYSDSVDKSTVKSLAFEFLDAETGEQAILPENNLIYVEVKMKAPVEADGLTADGKAKYAYNNCFTQWNALDSMGQAVDFITGINSNTVKVTVNDRVSVQINKVWEDEENRYNTRPDTVEFVMKKDGAEVDRQTLEKGKSTVTFSGLLVDELSTYTFEEVCPEGYETDGVIYDKVLDTYTATNTLDPNSLVEIKGTKTWLGGLDSEMPESITINLYRDDVKIDSKVVRASDGWKYNFGKFIKTNSNGTEYKYRIEEEPVEGWISSYAAVEGGLNIKFSENSRTESSALDYVEIYYPGGDGKIYKLPKIGGSSIAGKVVGVPSKNFWLYWRTDSSDSNYYGFSIDSIESASVEETGTVATLPNYNIEYLSGGNYPDSAFDGHTHGNYGDNVNKIWHYGTNMNRFDINNIANKVDIEGTKRWEGDTPEMRPASITVNLLQNGKQFMSTTTDASKGWKYSFRVPKIDTDTYKEYVYTVREEPVEGYSPTYSGGNGCKITFSADSKTESMSYDYLEVYYAIGNYFYKAGKFGGNNISGASITLPSKHFFLHWKTDGSENNYYGYRVESIEDVEFDTIIGDKATLPTDPGVRIEYSNKLDFFQSEHSPYKNNADSWKAYMSVVKEYDILNTSNITTVSGTKHWEGDTEEMRPESITVNLLQDGVQYATTTTDASKGWQYSFTAPKFDDTGRDYVYSVSEESVEGYRTEYPINTVGREIVFSQESETINESAGYVEIYYIKDGSCYRTGRYSGSELSGKRVKIPTNDFYLLWNSGSTVYNYYGFSIESIIGSDSESIEGVKYDLPSDVEIVETRDINDLTTITHYPYMENERKLWHYSELPMERYDVKNVRNLKTISGTKHWVGDTEEERPDSITVKLLQNGVEYKTVTTDAAKNWKYSFEVPIMDERGISYEYELKEVEVEGYLPSHGTGSRITFSSDSVIDSYDRLRIFYFLNDLIYEVVLDRNTLLSNYTLDIPSSDFLIDWHKWSNTNSKFSVISVDSIDCSKEVGTPWFDYNIYPDKFTSEVSLLHSGASYSEEEEFKINYINKDTYWDITNRKDNITFEFSKDIRDMEYNSFSGIGFSIYENVKETGYPKAFPGKSDEWVKVSDAKVSSKGFCEISGLKSYKEYFLVENASEVTIEYRGISTKHKILRPEKLCYVVKTGNGCVVDVYATIYGYSRYGGDYSPKKSLNGYNFFLDYGGDVVGSDLNTYLDKISSRYDSVKGPGNLSKDIYLEDLLPYFGKNRPSCRIDNYVEKSVINVTKKIKASDINFDNGNPTFIFEHVFTDGEELDSQSSIADIKTIEFTKEYVEANTDSDGFVSKTVTFEKNPQLEGLQVSIREVQSSRYNVSKVTCNTEYTLEDNGTEVNLGYLLDINSDINIVFTNDKYENQYYGHNSVIVNKLSRNKHFWIE